MTFKMVQLQKVITSTNLVNPFQQYSQKQYLLHQEETAGLREQLRNETKRSVKRGAQLIIQSNLSIATQAQEITPKLLPLRRKSAHDILFRQLFTFSNPFLALMSISASWLTATSDDNNIPLSAAMIQTIAQ
ncbi:hypothetical protein CU097_013056 [Rhizopus azygosporus]|uniref:Uncharacterized protein n=1 Tax=Rhizopus azygosporus TaxID=86630 RepID=A0A367KFG6_RHIAZ|nr:hypothetical protein CU097_013056 [Rhizopus azygosporus]